MTLGSRSGRTAYWGGADGWTLVILQAAPALRSENLHVRPAFPSTPSTRGSRHVAVAVSPSRAISQLLKASGAHRLRYAPSKRVIDCRIIAASSRGAGADCAGEAGGVATSACPPVPVGLGRLGASAGMVVVDTDCAGAVGFRRIHRLAPTTATTTSATARMAPPQGTGFGRTRRMPAASNGRAG